MLIITSLFIMSHLAIGQVKKISRQEVIQFFQKDLANGIDLTEFDKISNPNERKRQMDLFTDAIRAKGMIAQTFALKQIDFKSEDGKATLSDHEILELLFERYKAVIPELRESYLDFFKKKYLI